MFKGKEFQIGYDHVVMAKRRGQNEVELPHGTFTVEAVSIPDGSVEIRRGDDRDFYVIGLCALVNNLFDGVFENETTQKLRGEVRQQRETIARMQDEITTTLERA